MALKFNCSRCGQEIIVKFLKVGEVAKCPGCGAEISVPANVIEIREASKINRPTASENILSTAGVKNSADGIRDKPGRNATKTIGIVIGFIGSTILTAILVIMIIQLSRSGFDRVSFEMSQDLQIFLVVWGICAVLGLVGSIVAISNKITGGILMLIGGGIPLAGLIYVAIQTGGRSLTVRSVEDIILPTAILSLFFGGCCVLSSPGSRKITQIESTYVQYCSNCGIKIESGDTFCPQYGVRVE